MSIIIKGMEMPHDCPNCEFSVIGYVSPMSTDCTLYCRATDCVTAVIKEKSYEDLQKYHSRPDWCPLLPLPEGHGRLIDAEAFVDYMQNRYDNNEITNGDWIDFRLSLKDQPTIMPAEGGTDNECD